MVPPLPPIPHIMQLILVGVGGRVGCVLVGMGGCISALPSLQMAASGLGARYASLPTEREWFEDSGWWPLLREGELLGAVPELRGMLQLLEFCDSVFKVCMHV